jgi:hypothetical protein
LWYNISTKEKGKGKMEKVKFSQHMLTDRVDRYVMIATKVGFGEVLYSTAQKGRPNGTTIAELTTTGVMIVKTAEGTIVTMYCATLATAMHTFNLQRLPSALYKVIVRNQTKGYCNY